MPKMYFNEDKAIAQGLVQPFTYFANETESLADMLLDSMAMYAMHGTESKSKGSGIGLMQRWVGG